MPTITVPVQADPDTGTLIVNGNGNGYQIEVSENSLPQTIQWDLRLSNHQSGGFNSLSDSTNPGFAWTYEAPPDPPPPGFSAPSEPSTTPPNIQIQVTDTHTKVSNNNGTWPYKLCATVNGVPCETNPPSPRANPGDPTIRNKPS